MYTLVIADDEMIEQKVLGKMTRELCPGVELLTCVSNGAELMACVEQQHPDIVILDINMPVINGLDALEWIQLKEYEAKVLVVSAYSSFQYAQRAMRLGASGYILKPVSEVEYVQAVRKLCGELDKERRGSWQEEREARLKTEYQRTLENEILSDLLLGETASAGIQKYEQQMQHSFCGGLILMIRRSAETGRMGSQTVEVEEEQLQTELNRLCTCFGKRYKNMYVICLLPSSEEEKGSGGEWACELLKCVRSRLPELHWETMIVGASSWKNNFEELAEAVKESRIVLQGVTQPGFYSYISETPSVKSVYHKQFYQCRQLLKAPKQQENERALQQELKSIRQRESDMGFLRIFAYALRCAGEHEPEDGRIFGGVVSAWKYWRELADCQNDRQIEQILWRQENSAELQKDDGQQKEARVYVERCIRYLEQHYQENIVLENAAERIGITGFYLSRLFKQETGRTFLEILTDIRMGEAMDRMWQTNESFQVIAEKVGYESSSYFYRLFKRKTGWTANEMRKALRRILE